MKLQYMVESVADVDVIRDVEIDGVTSPVRAAGVAVQLTSAGHGSISLNLTAGQADGHPFEAGKPVTVTFGGAK